MSLEALMTLPAVIRRAGSSTDRYGNSVENWTAATSTSTLAWVSQTASDWQREHRNAELSGWIAYFPAGVDIRQGDHVEVIGLVFTVKGPPHPAHRPGGLHHVEAQLDLVEG